MATSCLQETTLLSASHRPCVVIEDTRIFVQKFIGSDAMCYWNLDSNGYMLGYMWEVDVDVAQHCRSENYNASRHQLAVLRTNLWNTFSSRSTKPQNPTKYRREGQAVETMQGRWYHNSSDHLLGHMSERNPAQTIQIAPYFHMNSKQETSKWPGGRYFRVQLYWKKQNAYDFSIESYLYVQDHWGLATIWRKSSSVSWKIWENNWWYIDFTWVTVLLRKVLTRTIGSPTEPFPPLANLRESWEGPYPSVWDTLTDLVVCARPLTTDSIEKSTTWMGILL